MNRDNMAVLGAFILLLLIIFFFFGGGGGPATCTSDTDCGAGETCGPDGTCGFFGGPGSPCNLNEDCQDGLLCIDGFCQAPPEPGGPGSPCNLNEDCQDGLLCIDGTCQAPGTDPCAEIQCPTPQVCYEGACVAPGVADCLSQGGTWMEKEGVCCPSGTVWDFVTLKCELSEEAANCISQGGTWNEATDSCDCPPRQIWDSEAGECVPTWGPACDPSCEEGEACVGGECVPLSSLSGPNTPLWIYSPSSGFCDGCPAEDSLVTQMFLDPDINEKTVSAVLFVEKGAGERALVTDATFFVQIVPKDGSPKITCRTNSFEVGEAEFAYSNYPICEDVGCMVRFIFCCANISEGCLIPLCLNDALVQEYTDVSPCDSSFSGDWPVKAKVDGETINLYPAIDELSIPPKPKFEGTAFAFELCLPVLVIFGLLSAAMFAAGRNPFQMFAFHTQRVKRAPERAIRARGMSWNVNAIAGSVVGALQGQGKKPLTLGKKMGDIKKTMGKIKQVKPAVKSIKAGGMPAGAVKKAGGEGLATGGERGMSRAGALDTVRDTGDPRQNLLARGAGTSVGRDMGLFGAVLGQALIAKLLGGSAFTSWMVYGTRTRGGLLDAIDAATERSYAPKLMQKMGAMLAGMGYTVTIGEDGKTVISALDPVTGKPVTSTYDLSTTEGKAQMLKDFGETVVPVLIVYARAAEITAVALREGGDLHDSQQAAVKAGAEIYAIPSEEKIKPEDAAHKLDAPAGSPSATSTTEALEIVASATGMETDTGKNILETSGVQRALGELEARLRSEGTLPQAEMQLLAAAYQNAYGSTGAAGLEGTGAGPSTLARAGALLVSASAQATGTAPEGSKERAEALAFAIYAQAMVADSATRAGNEDLQKIAIANLGATHALASAEGSPVPKTENLTAMLSSMEEGKMDLQRYMAAVDGAAAANNALNEHATALAGMRLTQQEYKDVYGEEAFNKQFGDKKHPEDATFRMPDDGTYTHMPPNIGINPNDPTASAQAESYYSERFLAETMYSSSSESGMLQKEIETRMEASPPQSAEDFTRIYGESQKFLWEQAQQTAQEMVKGAAAQGPEGQRGLDSYIRMIGEGKPMDTHPSVTTTTTPQGIETPSVQDLGDKLLSASLTINATTPSETSRKEAEHEASTASFEQANARYEQQLERNRQFWNQALPEGYSVGRGGELVGPPIDPFKSKEEAEKLWEEQKRMEREERKNRKHRPPEK